MTKLADSGSSMKAGDAVWVATALLHRQYPDRPSFEVAQIQAQVKALSLTHREDGTVYQHANLHCVANRAPKDSRLKMLIATADGGRKLFRAGDPAHPERNGRSTPRADDLPLEYRPLLAWYGTWSQAAGQTDDAEDTLLALRGSGKELWAEEHADAYVERLRREWL